MSRTRCLLIFSLVAIFSAALLMRIYPAKYGFYINEFDPYYDFYATNFIVENAENHGLGVILSDDPGINYFKWRDNRTWYPEGRAVAATSQSGLHFTGAAIYLAGEYLFGLNMTLYDFVVLFPVFIGALTTPVMFLLVRKIAGTTAGLFSALMIAFSPPIIARGDLGWFKSEPLALFFALSASYLFLSLYDTKMSSWGFMLRGLGAGLLLGYANTCWGGSQYFSIVFGLLLICSPFLKLDLRRVVYAGSLLVGPSLLVTAAFPRPGPSFILSPVGLLLLASLSFVIIAHILRKLVNPGDYMKTLVKVVFAFVLVGLTVLAFGLYSGVTGRYLTVVFPFIRTGNPLVESVAEHFVPTGSEYFLSYLILLFLSGFGVYMMFKKKGLYSAFALIFGISAIYIASSFSRLMVYSSVAFAMLGGIGFTMLVASLLKPGIAAAVKRRQKSYGVRNEVKIVFSILMIVLLTIPLVYPVNSNWRTAPDRPVSIANGATGFRMELSDWLEALTWMRENTPPEAVFAAWWDYGYWIVVMGNRTSLADNATMNQTRIEQIARMFMSTETEALNTLKTLKADYVVVFVVGQRVTSQGQDFYLLGGGGDESKKQWFIRIGRLNMSEYLYEDGYTPKPYFWDNIFLGKLFPFELIQYVDERGQFLGSEYQPGSQAVYTFNLKYTKDSEGPVRLAFVSSSLERSDQNVFAGVLVYEIIN